MSRESDPSSLVIGGPARANLLPPEVGLAAQGKVMRRNAVFVIILAILLVIAGYIGSVVVAATARAGLDAANQQTTELIAQQGKYSEVRLITSMLDTAAAARQVGMSTEIDWKDYLTKIQDSLPAGTEVTNVVAETATPLVAFNQPVVPLQGDRIGELKFTAVSQSLPDVEKWLDALTTLPGYVDASPGSVALNPESLRYEVTITLHIDKNALLDRFDDKARDARDASLKEKEAARPKPVATPKPAEPTPTPEPSETAPAEPTPDPSSTDGGE